MIGPCPVFPPNREIREGDLRQRQDVTLHVRIRGMRVWAVRWWCARALIALAARVAGCGIQIDREDAS